MRQFLICMLSYLLANAALADTVICELEMPKISNGSRLEANSKMIVSGNTVVLQRQTQTDTFTCSEGAWARAHGALVECVGFEPDIPMARKELRAVNFQAGSPVVSLYYHINQIIEHKDKVRPFLAIGLFTIVSCEQLDN